MIEITCPKCGKAYRLQDQLAGKRVRCRDCGETLDVPEPVLANASAPSAEAEGDDDDIPLQAMTPPAVSQVRAPTTIASAPSAASTPVAPKKRFGFRINRFAIALGVIGVVLFMTGLKEMRL